MRITFDPVKNARNISERGLPFERVAELDWDAAVIDEDVRKDYGEHRFGVLAKMGHRVHAAVVTFRQDATHVISFRKANEREARYYVEESRRRGLDAG